MHRSFSPTALRRTPRQPITQVYTSFIVRLVRLWYSTLPIDPHVCLLSAAYGASRSATGVMAAELAIEGQCSGHAVLVYPEDGKLVQVVTE